MEDQSACIILGLDNLDARKVGVCTGVQLRAYRLIPHAPCCSGCARKCATSPAKDTTWATSLWATSLTVKRMKPTKVHRYFDYHIT